MEKIREHLLSRPIASIYNASNEKNDDVALKLMCVIDFFIEKRGLNAAIDAVPKLREQLLSWASFKSFRYYSYMASSEWFTGKILQCKRCEFIGPYLKTLTHMAVNHDLHIGLKKCVWCNRMDFRTHIAENTAQECYEMYLAKEQIFNYTDTKLIIDFYDILKTIGIQLDVRIKRSDQYAGTGYKSNDYLLDVDLEGEVNQSIQVFNLKKKQQKEINIIKLNTFFRKAMKHFHGKEAHTFYGANIRNDDFLNNEPDERGHRTRMASPSHQWQPLNVTQAYGTYIALQVDSIKNPDIKQQTKRLIQEIIDNAQKEDNDNARKVEFVG